MKILTITGPVFLLLCTSLAIAKMEDRGTVSKPGWRKWELKRNGQPTLDIYGIVDPSQKNPVLVQIQGSKCFPLFREKAGKIVSPLFLSEKEFFEKRNLFTIAIDRRGVKSFEPIPTEIASLDPRTRCSDHYGGIKKSERVRDVVDALKAIQAQPWAGELIIAGHSEGVDIVTGVAKANPKLKLTALGLLAGASTSTFFDFIEQSRFNGKLEDVKSLFDDLI